MRQLRFTRMFLCCIQQLRLRPAYLSGRDTSQKNPDVAVIKDFERRLDKRWLRKEGDVWYADVWIKLYNPSFVHNVLNRKSWPLSKNDLYLSGLSHLSSSSMLS